MGFGNMVAGAAVDAAAKQAEMKRMLKGRTPEQQSVIKYFYGAGGCLSKGLTDEQYDQMVQRTASSMDFKAKALAKIGLDESQVSEIEPVHFEAYYFTNKNDNLNKMGKDYKWRSSEYMVTWIFFSDAQIYVYQYTFNMCSGSKKEQTMDYFYKDVTNFTAASETYEKDVLDKVSCSGKATYVRKSVDANEFRLIVPGDKVVCSMEQNDYTERAIQGMKAKLREKKA